MLLYFISKALLIKIKILHINKKPTSRYTSDDDDLHTYMPK